MRYACLVYFDPRRAFSQTAESEEVLRDAGDPANALRASGQVVSEAPLQLPDQAITLRVQDGKLSTTDGPFMETKEMLGGIVIIEAKDLNDAVRVAALIPHARMGAIEVRPFVDFSKPRPRL